MTLEPPDVLLFEIALACPRGLDCVRKLSAIVPESRILIFTSESDPGEILQALMAGAWGYINKPVTHQYLMQAIVRAGGGLPVLCDRSEIALLQCIHRMGSRGWLKLLTKREREILTDLAQNRSNKEIATRLGIAAATVHVHIVSLFRKLGIHKREEVLSVMLAG